MRLWIVGILLAVGLQAGQVMLSTTTSTDHTGLLDALAPAFEADTGVRLRWVAVGSGQALALGRGCDVDAVLTHDPHQEDAFESGGYGIDRTAVMHNDFVIVAPKALVQPLADRRAVEVFEYARQNRLPFISRGDRSGTHAKELWLWDQSAAGRPQPRRDTNWYFEVGQGMIESLILAQERGAMALTDRGTYLKYRDTRGESPRTLAIVHEGDGALKNPYTLMAVNPEKCPDSRYQAAKVLMEWFASDTARAQIAAFRLLNQPLFFVE